MEVDSHLKIYSALKQKKSEICWMSRRIIWHIGFWLSYTLVYALLNTGFAAPSDLAYSLPIRFLRFWAGELILLPIKITTAYLFIYWLVPRYLLKRAYWQMVIGSISLLIPAIILNRVATYHIIFPFLYGEIPAYELYTAKRFLYALLNILPVIGIVATIKLLRHQLAEQKRIAALEKGQLVAELSFLKAQTNPHFLFNTLNNIYALARKKSEQTAPVVLQLSKILRFMLYECNQHKILIQREVQIIEDYLELEKLRYNDRLKLNFTKKITAPNQAIAPLLLLPFVENAFKHSANHTRFDTTIDIILMVEKNQLNFKVKNQKEDDTEKNELGIGLKNVQRQLELTYPEKYSLHINDADFFL